MFGKKMLLPVVAVVCGSVCLMTGCEKQIEGNETTHPVYIKAKKEMESNNYKDAAKSLSDLLAKAPKSGLLHKELAKLYANMDPADYYRAIYHLSCYMELCGSGISADDKHIINSEIEEYKRRAAQEYSNGVGTSEVTSNMNTVDPEEVARLKEEIGELKMADATQKNMIAALREQLAAKSEALKQAAGGKKKAAAKADAVAETVIADDVETFDYTVQAGDTLSRIVKKNYGKENSAIVKKIVELNKLKNAGAIKLGQTLKLPKISK